MSKVVVITGASKGFWKIWADAFLQKGYSVAATARKIADLNELQEKYGEKPVTSSAWYQRSWGRLQRHSCQLKRLLMQKWI